MAKRRKMLPARKPVRPPEQALLLRSAESLGRVIGALQRQLDDATRRLTTGRRSALRRDAKAISTDNKTRARKRPTTQKRTSRKKTAHR